MYEITCETCLFTKIYAVVLLLFHDLPKSECLLCWELNFKANDHAVPKNNVHYKSVRYIEGLLREFDWDSAGSLKICLL